MINLNKHSKKSLKQDSILSYNKHGLEQFRVFLNDRAQMSPKEFTQKHGAYMGFKPEEIAQITGIVIQ